MILLVLSRAIERRDPYSTGHAARVTELADAIAVRLGWDEERRRMLAAGATLHDVGKLAVPEDVLSKPGQLSVEESLAMQRHPRAGAALVWRVAALRAAVPGVLFHHERWDGRGYPAGRSGMEIPAAARVLAVADAFDEQYVPTVVLAEAAHGTAPSLQGKDVANPMAMILAAAAVLVYGDEEMQRAGRAIREACLEAVADGVRTADLGGHAGTTEFTDEVIRRVRSKLGAGTPQAGAV